MQSSDVSRFACRRPHRYDSECPLPSPQPAGEKGTRVTHFTICHQKHTGLGNGGKNTNKTEIDLICFSISSRGPSGTGCRWQFSGQAWGPIAGSGTVQSKVWSRANMQEFRTKLCSEQPVDRSNCQGRSCWYVLSPVKHRTPSSSRSKDLWTLKYQKGKQVSWNILQ